MSKLNWLKTGCAIFLVCAVSAIAAPAQTLTTLFYFDGPDGNVPTAAPIQATDGNLYGTTVTGGANNFCAQFDTNGCGTVYKINPDGTETTIYSFCSQGGCTDGANPWDPLVQGSDGNFYGTTELGGVNDGGLGTIFKITPSGTLTTLYSFCSQPNCTDGWEPLGGLVLVSDGNFYGTTAYGGANDAGTVFKITSSGTLTTLYSFCSQSGCADGRQPWAGLIQASDGNFYGTTYGTNNGGGTVFKISPGGTLTTLASDLGSLTGTLVQASDGNLYGTTRSGTIFRVTLAGTLTTLYTFSCTGSFCPDGEEPTAGLVQATDGNLYGTTIYGGTGSKMLPQAGTAD
jgi:uncharacterized repeat protein (TIGR03803 family)